MEVAAMEVERGQPQLPPPAQQVLNIISTSDEHYGAVMEMMSIFFAMFPMTVAVMLNRMAQHMMMVEQDGQDQPQAQPLEQMLQGLQGFGPTKDMN